MQEGMVMSRSLLVAPWELLILNETSGTGLDASPEALRERLAARARLATSLAA